MSDSKKIVVVDASSGSVVEREMTQDEIEEFESLALQSEEALKLASDNRASALAKLAALGLTEEEIAAL
jgi:hypothetical protein